MTEEKTEDKGGGKLVKWGRRRITSRGRAVKRRSIKTGEEEWLRENRRKDGGGGRGGK